MFAGLYTFSPANGSWTAVAMSDSPPPPRTRSHLTATPNGTLYLFGGWNPASKSENTGMRVRARVRDRQPGLLEERIARGRGAAGRNIWDGGMAGVQVG